MRLHQKILKLIIENRIYSGIYRKLTVAGELFTNKSGRSFFRVIRGTD